MENEVDSTEEGAPDLLEEGFGSVGDRLRAVREAKRLDLSHIAAETRIPIRHLETIEAGAFEDLPSRAYAIGFARTYAGALELDQDEIVASVREELADGHARHSAIVGGMEPGDANKIPSARLAWIGGLAVFALAIGAVTILSDFYGAGDPLDPISVEDGLSLAQDTASAPASPAEDNAAAADPDGQVVFTALEDGIWVRIYEDGGERLFEAQMETGDRFILPSDAVEPRINTGRPDALAITIGGQSVPKLAEEPTTMGDTPVSAAALLARVDPLNEAAPLNN